MCNCKDGGAIHGNREHLENRQEGGKLRDSFGLVELWEPLKPPTGDDNWAIRYMEHKVEFWEGSIKLRGFLFVLFCF